MEKRETGEQRENMNREESDEKERKRQGRKYRYLQARPSGFGLGRAINTDSAYTLL